MHLILCGMPKCGKTTLGKLVAAQLQLPFVDVDSWVERAYAEKNGRYEACRQIFAKEGERTFRELESSQLLKLEMQPKSVVALGGGTLLKEENVRFLRTIGLLIYLKTPLTEIWKRIGDGEMPAYLKGINPQHSLQQLAAVRLPLYEKVSHVTIDTSDVAQAQIIEAIVGSYGQ